MVAEHENGYRAGKARVLAAGSLWGDRHISFMGAQFDATFSTILLDSGPAAAKVLLDDDVDVVLLTPV